MEGNQYARLSGPELETVLETRHARAGVFSRLGRYTRVRIAPYAALDLLDGRRSLNPVRNDHDANGQPVHLVRVQHHTQAGGTVRRRGRRLVYTPPPGGAPLDAFKYRIADTDGQTATGVVLAR